MVTRIESSINLSTIAWRFYLAVWRLIVQSISWITAYFDLQYTVYVDWSHNRYVDWLNRPFVECLYYHRALCRVEVWPRTTRRRVGGQQSEMDWEELMWVTMKTDARGNLKLDEVPPWTRSGARNINCLPQISASHVFWVSSWYLLCSPAAIFSSLSQHFKGFNPTIILFNSCFCTV